MAAAPGQHPSKRLLVNVFGPICAEKHDRGAVDGATAQIGVAGDVETVTRELDAVDRQRSF